MLAPKTNKQPSGSMGIAHGIGKVVLLAPAPPPTPREEKAVWVEAPSLPPKDSIDPDLPTLRGVEPVKLIRTSGKGFMMKGAKGVPVAASLPPKLQLAPNLRHVFRFRCTTSGSYNVTVGDILGALGVVGTSSTTVATMASSFKLNRVTVWPAPSSSGTATAALSWNQNLGQVADEIEDQSLPEGLTVTRPTSFSPPAKSLSSLWLSTDIFGELGEAFAIFTLGLPAGSIIDLDINYRTSAALANLSVTVSSATVGTVYYLGLDGPSSNKLVPTSLPTTS